MSYTDFPDVTTLHCTIVLKITLINTTVNLLKKVLGIWEGCQTHVTDTSSPNSNFDVSPNFTISNKYCQLSLVSLAHLIPFWENVCFLPRSEYP